MKHTEQGFVKFLLLIIIVAGSLFIFKDDTGQSYGNKIISAVENFISGIKDKTYEARDLMQEHQDELDSAMKEY